MCDWLCENQSYGLRFKIVFFVSSEQSNKLHVALQ